MVRTIAIEDVRMALAAKLYPPEATQRRDRRHEALLGATLRGAARVPLDIVVADISSSGFSADFPEPMAPGTPVRIGIAGLGVREARVARQDGARHGCAFETPLAAGDLAQALRADTGDVVVAGRFGDLPGAPATAPALRDDRWPGWVRLTLVIGLPLGMWGGLLSLGARLLR